MHSEGLSNCQEILKLVQEKRLSNEELKEDFSRKLLEILNFISEEEGYRVEVESYAEVRLCQHDTLDQELEDIQFKLEEINVEEDDSLLSVEDEIKKIEEELEKLLSKYKFTKVFFWE